MVGISAPVQQSNVENSFHTLFTRQIVYVTRQIVTLFHSERKSFSRYKRDHHSNCNNCFVFADLVLLRSFSGMFIKTKYSNVLGKPVERIERVGCPPWAGRERWWRLVGGRGSTICPAFQLFPTGNPKTVIHPKGYSVIAQILLLEKGPTNLGNARQGFELSETILFSYKQRKEWPPFGTIKNSGVFFMTL